jgi:predicted amidohydrolase YtcJ
MDATLLTGARVLTPDAQPAEVDSVGIVGSTIVAVGRHDDVAAALPSGARRFDLAGRTVVPGFVDAHLHPLPMCFFEHHLDLADATSLAGVLDLLADRARTAAGSEWVLGLRLDDERLAERRLPSRVDLDRVGGGRPVVVLRRDGHHAVGSTAALAAAGIDERTPDPDGGTIHRDAGGLTGLCGEAAASLLLSAVPVPPWEALEAALARVVARLSGDGVTAISAICQTSDVGPSGAAGALEAAAWSAFVEQVPFDVQTILVAATPREVEALRSTPLHRPGDGRRLDAVKLFLDGTLGGHTACMHQPFADHAGAGMLTLDPGAAYAAMEAAHLAGLQVCVHAIGDRANRVAADLFGRLLAEHPVADHRHRVEHASVLDGPTVEQLAALGITAVVQPISIASERAWLAKRLGPGRVDRVYPYRSLLDAGVPVAGSSDAPIESTGVLAAMAAATDRLGVAPAQAVSPAEALAMYTTGGAAARRSEHEVGRLAAGRRADLVVLGGDPLAAPADCEVQATVAGGRVTFDPAGRLGDGRR